MEGEFEHLSRSNVWDVVLTLRSGKDNVIINRWKSAVEILS